MAQCVLLPVTTIKKQLQESFQSIQVWRRPLPCPYRFSQMSKAGKQKSLLKLLRAKRPNLLTRNRLFFSRQHTVMNSDLRLCHITLELAARPSINLSDCAYKNILSYSESGSHNKADIKELKRQLKLTARIFKCVGINQLLHEHFSTQL